MPDPTPPGDAGGVADRPPGPLTPLAIDAVLADFRRWLEELALSEPDASATELKSPVADASSSDGIDLATLVGAFTALRHEVHLQTKATRAQSEQMADALAGLQSPTQADHDALRPFVTAVIETYDTLTRTAAEIDRLRDGLVALRDNPPPADPPADAVAALEPAVRKPTFLERLFGGRSAASRWEWEQKFVRLLRSAREVDRARHDALRAAWQKRWADAAAVADRLAAAATGLRMSERRVERLMRDVGIEPIETAGQSFDPESMEAVEAVADSGRPSGTVVDELRRGYRWRGRVFRFAQVRVAK
jgi:molecular chaperone GrpE